MEPPTSRRSLFPQNAYGYDEYEVSATGLNVPLNGNTYWLNLQNASVPSGDPAYWDENSGMGCHSQGCPSQASDSAVGDDPIGIIRHHWDWWHGNDP